MKVLTTDKVEIEISVDGKVMARQTLYDGAKHRPYILGSNPHPGVRHSGGGKPKKPPKKPKKPPQVADLLAQALARAEITNARIVDSLEVEL